MSEDESYVVKKRDLAEIIRTENSGALEEFLKDPLAVIAGAITEGLANGPKAFAGPAVRIAHSVLKGKLLQQFAQEVKELREKGKLADDFGERKYGYATWVDLLTIIDEETPDEDRLEALKAMFYSANKVNAKDGEQIFGYQLFQIAKQLNSNDLLVLKTAYGLHKEGELQRISSNTDSVFKTVSSKLGHPVVELVQIAYQTLNDKKLTSGTHLTDLGLKFCENIERYQIDKKG